jgi:5S rRNA maturation endonuclease (ribonuclease M5)
MFIPHNSEKILNSLKEFSLIVEGKRDKNVLEQLGFSNIFTIAGSSIDQFFNRLPENERYVVLTDFDSEGERKKEKIYKLFEKNKMSFNSNLRLKIKDLFKVIEIEELVKLLKLKEDVHHGEISSINYKVFNRSTFYRKWCGRETRCNRSRVRPD